MPSVATTRKLVAVYQTGSISMRPLLPRIVAVLDPAPRDEDKVVETAPEAWVITVATSVSVPTSWRRPTAEIEVGSPRMSQMKETG